MPTYGNIALLFDNTIKRDENLKNPSPTIFSLQKFGEIQILVQNLTLTFRWFPANEKGAFGTPSDQELSHQQLVDCLMQLLKRCTYLYSLLMPPNWCSSLIGTCHFKLSFHWHLMLFWKNHFKIRIELEAEFSLKKRWLRIFLKLWCLR